MNDNNKTCLATVFFISMFVFAFIGLVIGWVGWDVKTGVIVAGVLFAIFFLMGGITLAIVKDLSWFAVSLPMLAGLLYTIMPDFIPGPIDDAAAMASGAIFTFTLWLRKQPETPKWIVFPLLAAGVYTLVGALIPGPVDELLVTAIAGGVSAYGYLRDGKNGEIISVDDESNGENVVDAFFQNSENME